MPSFSLNSDIQNRTFRDLVFRRAIQEYLEDPRVGRLDDIYIDLTAPKSVVSDRSPDRPKDIHSIVESELRVLRE